MDNRSWKKERDLLSEAYGKTKTVTEEEGLPVSGETEEPIGGEELNGDPVDAIIDAQREPDEVDAEIESLKNLLLNPPAAKIEEYAKSLKQPKPFKQLYVVQRMVSRFTLSHI